MKSRVLFAGLLALLLVLPGFAGVHQHWSLAAGHDQIEDLPVADLASGLRSVGWFDTGHEHGHEQHGEVDVDPPAKAFSKSFSGKVPLTAALFGVLLLLIVPVQSRVLGTVPPLRPPRHRSRPYLFPPSQAPPSAG